MSIPVEAVEAAEEAVIDAMIKYGPDGHIDGYQEIARAALEAAAPHMLAEAWDQGSKAAWGRSTPVVNGRSHTLHIPGGPQNPYRPAP